jgi:23S rRNA (uracil1939-C5)-methyltransferase
METDMKKGQIVEGIVEHVDFPNKGVVLIEETNEAGERETHRVEVKGVIPGQKVRVSIKKARKGKAKGILREVTERSAIETAKPECPHFGTCGGCSYQTIPYDKQLELKKNQVLDLLHPVCDGISDFVFDGILSSPKQWEYRNKMEFSFGDEVKDGPLTLGLHKKGGFYDIIHVNGCRIVHPDFRLILDTVRDYCADNQIPYYRKNSHEGVLRHLLVRRSESTGELLAALVTSSQYEDVVMEEHLNKLSELLQKQSLEGTLTGFLHIINDSLGDVVKSDETHIICGKDWFMETVLGLQFRITPFSFFQTNTKGAEVLYQRARDYVLTGAANANTPADTSADTFADKAAQTEDPGKTPSNALNNALSGKTVFDLYSGTGTIAQIIAPVAGHVIGVEIVEEAVEAARENAALNGLSNCDFITGDVLKVIDEIEEKPDYIVLDPPRDGIHPKALKKIIDYGVPEIVYISCKPTSLARDLVVLQESGYRVERVSCVDLFCSTVHVETVVKLSLKKDTPKIEVIMKPDEESTYTPEEKATYPKIKEYVKNKYGVHVHTSYIAQVKRMCGMDMGENYNRSKKENPEVKQCPQEKVEYIKDALRYFGLIG